MAVDLVGFAFACRRYHYADASQCQPWLCHCPVGFMLGGGCLDSQHGDTAILVYASAAWVNAGGNPIAGRHNVQFVRLLADRAMMVFPKATSPKPTKDR